MQGKDEKLKCAESCLVDNSIWGEIEGSGAYILPENKLPEWEVEQHEEANAPCQYQQQRVKHPLHRLILDEILLHLSKRSRVQHCFVFLPALILFQQALLQAVDFQNLVCVTVSHTQLPPPEYATIHSN